MTRMGYRHTVVCRCGSDKMIVDVTEHGCEGDEYHLKCAKCGRQIVWWEEEQAIANANVAKE